ncbi:MAG: hypothetical protein JNL96_10055 [Planctomycetaceae bacterium]|nr:hypothetical protein [Planctomycetaceae bacterium]
MRSLMRTRGMIAGALCGAMLYGGGALCAPATTQQELQRRLAATTSVTWSGAPLREALTARCAAGGVGLVIDRRVDPGAPLELSAVDEPLESVLRRAASAQHCEIAVVGPVVYFGPAATARRVRTTAALRRQEAQNLPAAIGGKLLQPAALAWPELSEPREIVTASAAEAGLRLVDAERVPHDLWPAADLPALPLYERLTMILAQFDLAYRVDAAAGTMTLVPLDDRPTIERRYTVAGDPAATIARWRAAAPEATFRAAAGGVVVAARVEDHERLAVGKTAGTASGPATTRPAGATGGGKPPAGEKRYSLKLKNKPLGELVKLLRDGHRLPIEVDDAALKAAGISLDTLTSVEVADATLQQLLEQAAAPLGLAVQAVDGKLRITPRK